MKFIIVLLLLLAATATVNAQLVVDKEQIDLELHPGEIDTRTLTLINTGDDPILDIVITPLGGNARDLLFIPEHEIDEIDTANGDPDNNKLKVPIVCAVPPEEAPGIYSGFIYIYDGGLPNIPIAVHITVRVLEQESYGVSMFIDDARSASAFAKADEPAIFDLLIKNLGRFRDVASIDASELPEAWKAILVDEDDEHSLPYEVTLSPGSSKRLTLAVETSEPGQSGDFKLTATSLGNKTKNSSVEAEVEFGLAVRGYNVKISVPEKMATNRTYKGSFRIFLEVEERVLVGINAPPNLMAIPLTQVVEVTPQQPGTFNFTMLASQPGNYPVIFNLVDSNGIPMPEEATVIQVADPKDVAILTGDDFLSKTIASLSRVENQSVPVISLAGRNLDEMDQERLQAYSKVVILGNESQVSPEAEKALQGIEVKRIVCDNLCEITWRFTSEMWQNGTSQVVLSAPTQMDIFRAYQQAKMHDYPLIICDSGPSDTIKSIVKELVERPVKLSRALVVGDVNEEMVKTLAGMNITVEEVAQ